MIIELDLWKVIITALIIAAMAIISTAINSALDIEWGRHYPAWKKWIYDIKEMSVGFVFAVLYFFYF